MNNGKGPNKVPAPPPVLQGQGNAVKPPVIQGQGNAVKPPVIQGQGNAVNVANPVNQVGGAAARPPVIQGQGNAGNVVNPVNQVGGAASGLNVGPTPTSPDKPRGFETWQWVKVTAGLMSSAKVGQALTGNSYMLSTTIGNGELYAAKSLGPANALWRFIIPGDRAQFALSSEAPKDSPSATLVMPEWGETSTARSPTWSVRFGKQPFHAFGWAASVAPAVAPPAGAMTLPPISFVELDNSNQPLFYVTAQFPNHKPPVMCWQLWHLRRPNDTQPLGDQNPATNGCDEYKQAVERQARLTSGARRPAQLLDGRRGHPSVDSGGDTTNQDAIQSPAVLPVDNAPPIVGPPVPNNASVVVANGGLVGGEADRSFYEFPDNADPYAYHDQVWGQESVRARSTTEDFNTWW
jgi:hypothetical protein